MYTEPCHNADTHYIQLTFQVERFNILRHQSFQCLITYTINKISSAPWQRYAIISTHTHTHRVLGRKIAEPRDIGFVERKPGISFSGGNEKAGDAW